MTIHQLLSTIAAGKSLGSSVICISGESYPLIFCAQLFSHLKKSHQLILPSFDTMSGLYAQLGTSFLGTSSWYWLRSLDDLSKSKKESLISYLSTYDGPNTIFFFSKEMPRPVPKSWSVVTLPASADAQLTDQILSWYNGNAKAAHSTIKKLLAMNNAIPIDTAVLLVHYALVMGKRSDQFISSWLNNIVEPTSSLFSIAQALFAKQPRQFFTQIGPIQEYYGPQFWVSFWSEQLWRAAMYSTLMHARKPADAKRISFRLPFSFLNRDWRRYEYAELQSAHHFLYDIDYQLKHGGTPVALDLFYGKFLAGDFAQS